MKFQSLILVSAVLATGPATALAGPGDVFAGIDVSTGSASGSSGTTNGGAPFAGGGVVNHVRFGEATGIGAHIGYRLDPAVSVFLSYQHAKGDIDWNADFPLIGAASEFAGSAISNAVMGGVAYEFPLSKVTAVRVSAGLGATFNTLSGIAETDKASGVFLSDVANHTRTSPVAQLGAGVRYRLTSNTALGLDAAFSYTGAYETGDTRVGNLGVTAINPYRIDDVWRATLDVSFEFRL